MDKMHNNCMYVQVHSQTKNKKKIAYTWHGRITTYGMMEFQASFLAKNDYNNKIIIILVVHGRRLSIAGRWSLATTGGWGNPFVENSK